VLCEKREIRTREQVIASAQRLYKLGTIGTGVSYAFRSEGRSQGGKTQTLYRAKLKEDTLEGHIKIRKCY
jgi:hypothetical protein